MTHCNADDNVIVCTGDNAIVCIGDNAIVCTGDNAIVCTGDNVIRDYKNSTLPTLVKSQNESYWNLT